MYILKKYLYTRVYKILIIYDLYEKCTLLLRTHFMFDYVHAFFSTYIYLSRRRMLHRLSSTIRVEALYIHW